MEPFHDIEAQKRPAEQAHHSGTGGCEHDRDNAAGVHHEGRPRPREALQNLLIESASAVVSVFHNVKKLFRRNAGKLLLRRHSKISKTP